MLPGFLPPGNGSMSPHSGIWASTQEGSIGGQCLAAEAASGHTNTAYGSIITPSWASLLHQESMGLDELMFSELSVVLLHFSVHLFFFLKRDFKRGSCISAIFELSWWSLTLFFFFMGCSLPTAPSLFELTGLKPSVVWLHLKSVQNHQGWIWTMYLFVMLQLVALVMIIMCHKENILSLCAEQTAGTF